MNGAHQQSTQKGVFIGEIMVVDDAPDSLKLLSHILTNKGYNVRTNTSGTLALRSVAIKLPDLVLLDVKMDEMDGYEVCRRFKASAATRDIPVIFISGLDDIQSKIKGFDAGGIDYINKPFQSEEILARVKIHLELRRLQMQLEDQVHLRTSELEQANQALSASERKFKRIFDEMQNGYLKATMDGVIELINPAAVNMLGYVDAGEILGRNIIENVYVRREDRTLLMQILTEKGSITGHHLLFKKRDGEQFLAEVNARILTDGDQKPVAIEGIFQDITQRQRSEAEREALIAELKAKNSELERFTYTVSHDLKSPLVTIEGFLGFIAKDAASGNFERLHTDIQRISKATRTMNRLLDELLQLSRIGRMVNPSEKISMDTLVREATEMVFGRIDELGVDVQVDAELLEVYVYVDRLRIREMLINLLDNACKFMGDQQQPCIEIGCRDALQGVEFFVKDNGIGIEPQYHNKVFGLFERLNPDVTGTGIGLAIVKQIVLVHGGEIWIETPSKGPGTMILFTLSKPPLQNSTVGASNG